MWLHFDRGSDAAVALYVGSGFSIVSVSPAWRVWPKRRSLLCRQLTPVAPWPTSNTNVSGAIRANDGVVVWEEETFVE